MTTDLTGVAVPIQLAVLDMAGTTVADGGIVTDAFLAALESVGISRNDPGNPQRLQHVAATMGQSKIEVFRALLDDEAAARTALDGFEDAIRVSIESGRTPGLPGAADAIAELRDQGVRVCLTTGFTAETQDLIIESLGWDDLVDLTLAPGPGMRGRPHPDLVLGALMALGVDDVRAVAVAGDTTNDLLSGYRAGAGIVAGVLTGAHDRATLARAPHTHLLDSVSDLPDVVSTHNGAASLRTPQGG
jgi:phosphoglycolate phosphatase